MNCKDNFEKELVEHCSPTLAALKTASLFSVSYSDKNSLDRLLLEWNVNLSEKGVSIEVLRENDEKAMLYVYRESMLGKDLKKQGVQRFLKSCGYTSVDIDYAIERLKKRIKYGDSFPHEIGLFLGYPLGDVIGFIANRGRNCKMTGFWKVYCNCDKAERDFFRFRKCKDAYCRLWENGKSVQELALYAR